MYALTEHLGVTARDLLRVEDKSTFPESLLAQTSFDNWRELPSGRAAIQWALEDAGVEPGDEVVIPAYTCWAVRHAVEKVGDPTYVDVGVPDYTLDVGALRDVVSDDTAAIVAVHMYGRPCDVADISEIAAKHGAVVIEDACQAIGATVREEGVGAFSDYCVYSFRFYKELTAFHGGIALCNDPPVTQAPSRNALARTKLAGMYLFDTACRYTPAGAYEPLRRRVLDPVSRRSSPPVAGSTRRRLSAWQRDTLDRQFRGLPHRIERRVNNAKRYRSQLTQELVLPAHEDGHTFFRYPVLVEGCDRDELVKRLRSRGIGCSTMYAYSIAEGGGYPAAERAAADMVNLPVHAGLGEEEIDHIATIVNQTLSEVR